MDLLIGVSLVLGVNDPVHRVGTRHCGRYWRERGTFLDPDLAALFGWKAVTRTYPSINPSAVRTHGGQDQTTLIRRNPMDASRAAAEAEHWTGDDTVQTAARSAATSPARLAKCTGDPPE